MKIYSIRVRLLACRDGGIGWSVVPAMMVVGGDGGGGGGRRIEVSSQTDRRYEG